MTERTKIPTERFGVCVRVKNNQYIEAIERLAEYEDTGCTPEEVNALKADSKCLKDIACLDALIAGVLNGLMIGNELLKAEIETLKAKQQWIPVSERLPEIDYDEPEYSRYVRVITVNDQKHVQELKYESNGYAKTEKGRLPRWVYPDGKIYPWEIVYWMPLPDAPEEG